MYRELEMTHIPKSYTVPSWPLSHPTPPPIPENSTDLHESQECLDKNWGGLSTPVHPCGDAPAADVSNSVTDGGCRINLIVSDRPI